MPRVWVYWIVWQLIFVFLRNLHSVLLIVAIPIYIPTYSVAGFPFSPYSSPTFILFVDFFMTDIPKILSLCETTSHCRFLFAFLFNIDVQHLFYMPWLSACLSLMFIQVFYHFLVFFLLSRMSYWNFEINLCQSHYLQIFTLILGFIPLWFPCCAKAFSLTRSTFLFLPPLPDITDQKKILL